MSGLKAGNGVLDDKNRVDTAPTPLETCACGAHHPCIKVYNLLFQEFLEPHLFMESASNVFAQRMFLSEGFFNFNICQMRLISNWTSSPRLQLRPNYTTTKQLFSLILRIAIGRHFSRASDNRRLERVQEQGLRVFLEIYRLTTSSW